MSKILITLVMIGSFTLFAIDKDLESVALEAYAKSNISLEKAPCAMAGQAPQALLIEGGGDMLPITYSVLISQEFNCGFFFKSIFTKIIVEADFDYDNDNFENFVYTVKSLESVKIGF